jgi:alcohol dehydrogenase YqhD (iron-dependent ADH family)
VQRTPIDTKDEEIWDLSKYVDRLQDLSEELVNEIFNLSEEIDDEATKDIIRKITRYISINQSLVTLHLLNYNLHSRENEYAIDKELHEISEHVSEILSVHIREAENLRKIL